MLENVSRSLVLTDSAMTRILSVIDNNKDIGSKFRVYVTGGGCSGFQYGFKFDSETAFDDDEVDTLYLLSDGKPNRDRNGGNWSSYDYNSTANYYANKNKDRDVSLKVNTTSLGLASPWMEKLSELTSGEYNQIDQRTLIENTEEDT